MMIKWKMIMMMMKKMKVKEMMEEKMKMIKVILNMMYFQVSQYCILVIICLLRYFYVKYIKNLV